MAGESSQKRHSRSISVLQYFWNGPYHVGDIQIAQRQVTVVTASQTAMGMVPAAILTVTTVEAWRPRLIAMTGVCAGVKDKVNRGDAIVAKQVFGYGSRKVEKGALTPDYTILSFDENLCQHVMDFGSQTPVLEGIRNEWQGPGKPPTELKAHSVRLGQG
jgi:hypothetical protein